MAFDISRILSANQVEVPSWLSKILETIPDSEFKQQIITLYRIAQKTQDVDLINWLLSIEYARQVLLYVIPFSDKLSYIDVRKTSTTDDLRKLLSNLVYAHLTSLLAETKRISLTERLFLLLVSKTLNTFQVFTVKSYAVQSEEIVASLLKEGHYKHTESILANKYVSHLSGYERIYTYQLELKPYIKIFFAYEDSSKLVPTLRIDRYVQDSQTVTIITVSNDKLALIKVPANLLQVIDQTEDIVVYQGINMPIIASILELSDFFVGSDIPLVYNNPLLYDIANMQIEKNTTVFQIAKNILPFLTRIVFLSLTPENVKYTQLGQTSTIDIIETVTEANYDYYETDTATELLFELYKLPDNVFNPFLFAVSIAEGIRTYADLVNIGYRIERSDVTMNTFLDLEITVPYSIHGRFRNLVIPYRHTYIPIRNKVSVQHLLGNIIKEEEATNKVEKLETPISLHYTLINDQFFVYIPDFTNTNGKTIYVLPFWTLLTNNVQNPVVHFTLTTYAQPEQLSWTVEDKKDINRVSITTEETIEVKSNLADRIGQHIETSKPTISLYRLKIDKPFFILEFTASKEFIHSIVSVDAVISGSEYRCQIRPLNVSDSSTYKIFRYIVYVPVMEHVATRLSEEISTKADSFVIRENLFEHIYLNLELAAKSEDETVSVTYRAKFNIGSILWKTQMVDIVSESDDTLLLFAPVFQMDAEQLNDIRILDDLCEEAMLQAGQWSEYNTYLLEKLVTEYKTAVTQFTEQLSSQLDTFATSDTKIENIPYIVQHAYRIKFFEYYILNRTPIFGLDEQAEERRTDRNYNLVTDSYVRVTIK